MKRDEIGKAEKIKDFLKLFSSANTRATYKAYLINFFEYNKKDPGTYLIDVRRLENGARLDILDSYEKDIADFQQHIISQGRQPKTVTGHMVAIRVFLKQYRIQLDDMVWDSLRARGIGSEAVTDDEAPTKQQLKNILSHSDAKGRALILTLASSGLRINETLQIKLKDIEKQIKDNVSPIRIRITPTGSKSKRPYVTFISDEAKESIKEWLKVRDDYLRQACAKTKIHKWVNGKKIIMRKSLENDNLFPFTDDTARKIWSTLIKKADCKRRDPNTNRYVIHVHSLRKYFKTNFSKYDYHMSEVFLGHKGYLGGVYDKMTEDEKRNAYLKGVEYLLIFSIPTDLTGINEELNEVRKENLEMKTKLEKLKNEVLTLQNLETIAKLLKKS